MFGCTCFDETTKRVTLALAMACTKEASLWSVAQIFLGVHQVVEWELGLELCGASITEGNWVLKCQLLGLKMLRKCQFHRMYRVGIVCEIAGNANKWFFNTFFTNMTFVIHNNTKQCCLFVIVMCWLHLVLKLCSKILCVVLYTDGMYGMVRWW